MPLSLRLDDRTLATRACAALVAGAAAVMGMVALGATPGTARAQTAAASAPPLAAAASAAPRSAWVQAPRLAGRLRAADLGLVINTADAASVQVGEHYIAARGLLPEQVLRLDLPLRPVLTRDEFTKLASAIARHFGRRTQALALAWTAPYAVECNAITGALALGFDAELCKQTCAPSRPSRYFNAATLRPFGDLGWRPAMLLAAPTVAQAIAMIDRGVAADGTLALRGRPPVNAMMLNTEDVSRRVRRVLFPPPGPLRPLGVNVQVAPEAALAGAPRVLMVSTGSVLAPVAPPPDWVPGGLGDHLTSFGGDLLGSHGQGTALDWIASGATASHGSVSEPCNFVQKFPHPQVVLLHYLQGSTLIEAYWKSVLWPQQSLFIGEPLAAPFSPPLRPTAPP